jgi:hypothetical protein
MKSGQHVRPSWATLIHRRIWVGLTCAAVQWNCEPRMLAADPSTTGDDPSVNLATSTRTKNVPFCPGGDRATGCLLGSDCRVTEQGCQVCQCLSPAP